MTRSSRRLTALMVSLALPSVAFAQRVPSYYGGALEQHARSSPDLRAVPTLLASDAVPGGAPSAVAEGEARFRRAHGAEWFVTYDARSGRPANVMGRGIPWLPGKNGLTWQALGVDPRDEEAIRRHLESAARRLVAEHASWLGVDAASLTVRPDGIQHPAPYLWFLHLDWAPSGIPAEDAYVVLRLNHGNLVQLGVHGIGDAPASALTAMDGARAWEIARSYVAWDVTRDTAVTATPELSWVRVAPDPAETDAWPGAWGQGYAYRLTYSAVMTRRGELGTWRARIDARTGELYELADVNAYGRIHGRVYPNGPNDPEVDRPFPFANFGNNQFADGAGEFPGNSGTCTLDGQFISVSDTCGNVSLATTTGNIDFGGSAGDDCTTPGFGGAGNTHASRSSYYHLTLVNQKGRTYLPGNSWLNAQLTDNVNSLFYGFRLCNAFWDGTSVNFFQSGPDLFGNDCANSGEVTAIYLHEWGHGLDQNDGNNSSPDGGTGETYGDVTAALQTHDSCMGPGFFLGTNCAGYGDACSSCDGVRDIDWAQHASNTPHTPANFTGPSCPNGSGAAGPCGKEVHCESYPSSEAVWDLANRDLITLGLDAATAWQVVDRLWYLTRGTSGSAFTCTLPNSNGCNASNLYQVFLVADDCDGNLANGTPHMTAIFGAFDRHAIACATPTVQNQACCPSIAAPTLTATPGSGQVSLSWNAVTNAVTYDVFRNEFGCTAGYTLIGSTAATSFTDTTVAAGITYFYRVQGKGASAACAGAMSNCAQATPTGGGCGTITLSPSSLPAGTVGAAYSQTITASGGTAPYTFAVTSGTLPAGLTLGSGGALTGTPTAAGTSSFTVTATDSIACTGSQAYSITITAPGGSGNAIVGMGLGQPNPNQVRVFTGAGAATSVSFAAYGAGQWGVNVDGGDIAGSGLEQIVTGPGPGAVFGPQVRGFQRDGASMGKVNFFAYGTLRFGVNVATGSVDGDGFAEIATGPGPGAVFGPHVRGWNVDGGAATSISKINFFAYGTLKFGVNVAGGSVDADAFAELETGPGPGAIFGPQVRGWNYDGATLTTISKINFNAFSTPQFGVNLASGDVEGDGFAEMACTPGPGAGAGFPPRFVAFDYDGAAVAPAPGFDVTLAGGTAFGGRVGVGDMNGNASEDLLAAKGRDAAANAVVSPYAYSGSALSPLTTFDAFPGSFFGANPAGGDLGY